MPTNRELDAMLRFIRECQLVAGFCVEPIDPLQLLAAVHSVFSAYPADLSRTYQCHPARVFLSLARHTLDALEADNASPKSVMAKSCRKRNLVVEALNTMITLNSWPSFSLGVSAARVGVSPSYLCAAIKAVTSYGFLEHLRAIRLLRAAVLLGEDVGTIREIAARCGYLHAFQLDRHFHMHLGVTPSRYRHLVRLKTRVYVRMTESKINKSPKDIKMR